MEEMIEKIHQAGLGFLAETDLKQTDELIVRQAAELINAGYASLYIREDEDFIRKAQWPLNEKVGLPGKNGFVDQAYKQRKIITVNKSEVPDYNFKGRKEKFKSALYLPLTDHEKCIGTLNLLLKKERNFNKQEKDYLMLFGSYASLAIKKAKLLEDTREALAIRDQFISIAGHELRTPLTSINGYIQLLISRMGDKNGQEGNWIRELYRESKRLTALVMDLLEINRMRAGSFQFTLKESALFQTLTTAADILKHSYPSSKTKIINDLDNKTAKYNADHQKLAEVIFRQAENILKTDPENEDIKINLSESEKNYKITITNSDRPEPAIAGVRQKDHEMNINGENFSSLLAKYILTYHKGSLTDINETGYHAREIYLPKQK